MPFSPGYYLLNFETVLSEVRSRYGDLLHPEELALVDAFAALPLNARRIYVRMLTRKGPWFREDALEYREISDPRSALEALIQAGFCDNQPTLQDLVSLLTREDLISWLKVFGISSPKQRHREDLVERLLELDEPELAQALKVNLRPVMPLHQEFWSLVCFLFFGNGEQDFSSFVVADIGHVNYETYTIDTECRLFHSRADVDFLFFMRDLRIAFHTARAAEDWDIMGDLTDRILFMDPHPGVRQQRRYHRLLNEVGRTWERRGGMDRALACFHRSQLPPARERIVRMTDDPATACRLAMEMAVSPMDLSEERFARVFLRRRAKQIPEAARWLEEHPLPEPVPELHLSMAHHPSGSVELAALEAAHAQGWEGFFTENVLWNALFGLTFWEELFADVPGAFQHRFQSAPLDIGSPDFYLWREAAITQRLGELRKDTQGVLETAHQKWGIANTFVAWRHLSRDMLVEAVERIPPPVLASVLGTMVQNPRAFNSGFPDLFLFKPDEKSWALWEVKGPGDVLRPEQERWLQHFNRLGCEARVAWVKYVTQP